VFPVRARFSRRTRFALFSVLAFLTLIVLAAGYFFWSRPTRASQSFNLQRTVTEIVADPVRYATNRFTGGIGVALFMDSATGLPKVNGVMPGSPAHAAGLARDDIFLEVNHTSMKGKTLPQAVDMVRGLTVGNVDILIQRNGTNLHCAVSRTSWTDLRKLGNIPETLPSVAVPRLILPANRAHSPVMIQELYQLPSALPLVETNL
jgi:membrane-associated protease RseP (regulator of RpoE activity)